MKASAWMALAGCILVTCSGCLAKQVRRDGDNFRQAVCDLYIDQALDNLIRAKCGMPFVQLNYRDMLVQDTDSISGSGGVDQTIATGRGLVAAAVTRMLTNKYSLSGIGKRDRQMSFHADPITDAPEIYEAYIQFANDPNLFMETDHDPGCPVHVMKKHCKRYYWVPCDAGPAFQSLVLRTSFNRGAQPAVSPAYEVEVVAVKDQVDVDPKRPGLINATLYFNNPIPNGEGNLLLTIPGAGKIRLETRPLFKDEGDKPVAEGESVKRLRVTFRPKEYNLDEKGAGLLGAKGQFYSYRFPRLVPPSTPLIQKIYDDLDRIRATQRLQ